MVKVIGLTNAVTDITSRVDDADLVKLGIQKGSYSSSKQVDMDLVEGHVLMNGSVPRPGGSPANTILDLAHLEAGGQFQAPVDVWYTSVEVEQVWMISVDEILVA